FQGSRGFAATSDEAEAELAVVATYRDAVAARIDDQDLATRIGLWSSDPGAALDHAAAAFRDGDLQASVEAAAYAKRIWTTAPEIGRNRALAVGGSLAAALLGLWLVFRWLRDRSVRRRPMVARQG